MCSGHAETLGSRIFLPGLPSQLRARVLCFRKKENFWKKGNFLFLNLLPIYSKCIFRDVAKRNNRSHKPIILKSWLSISVAKKALFQAQPQRLLQASGIGHNDGLQCDEGHC